MRPASAAATRPGIVPQPTSIRPSAADEHARSWRQVSDQADSHAAGPVIRSEVVSIIGAHIGRGTEPGAAAQFVIGAIAVHACRTVDRRAAVVGMPAILGPLKDIPQHVVETEGVALERTDRRRVNEAIIAAEYRPSGIAVRRAGVGHIRIGTRARSVRTPRLRR